MRTKEELLPKGRLIHLNNEGKMAKIWLEGLESTHIVEAHTSNSVVLKSLNAEKYTELNNFDCHYLTMNGYGGHNTNWLEHRTA